MKQKEAVKVAIMQYLDKGLINKSEIFTKVVDDLGVPRPTVRRCSRELLDELAEKIKILGSELDRVKS